MKIAHIVSTFPPQIGGMGMVCADEAQALARQGHEVTVFTLKYPHLLDLAEFDKKFSFKTVRLQPLIKFGDAGLVPQLVSRLKGFDLAHLHYPFYGGAEWLAFIKVPLIISYHMDAQTSGFKKLAQKLYDAFWPKILFAKAKKIISVDAVRSMPLKFYEEVKNKTVEVFNGVDTEIFKPRFVNARELNLPELGEKKIILFCGNTLPVKRLDLLLEAIKIINDDNVALLVVGDGYHLEKYRQMARDLGISRQTHFVGHCGDRRKIAKYYNIADCLALPSDYESFSLVTVEAMASELPVVASDIDALKSKITNGQEGFLFARGSAPQLSDALKKILSMSAEDRKVMGERGRQKAEAQYSWQKHIEKLEEVYKEILKY